jgi:ABC-type bacteriocin/lantibiotic exporter with double-glycine peptidase domain
MKKRKLIIIISIIVFLAATVTLYPIRKSQTETNVTGVWIKKTINKEFMQTNDDCGIATVKMLLDFYDKDVSYEELKTNINTTIEGTDWEDIKSYIQTLDYVKVIEFEDNLDKAKEYLEKGYPLFICWNVNQREDYSHYSILIAIDKYSVWMLDPEEKKSLTEYSLNYFLPCWKNQNYWFCVLEETDKKFDIKEQITEEKTDIIK